MDCDSIKACSSNYIPSNQVRHKFELKIGNKNILIRVANKEGKFLLDSLDFHISRLN